MIGKLPFEEFYKHYVEEPSEAYRQTIGRPVHLDATAFEVFLTQLRDFRRLYPNISFWQVVDYKSFKVTHKDGDLETFGHPFSTFKDVFRVMHPDYILPYLRWRAAAYELVFAKTVDLDPLDIAYRVSLPMLTKNNEYYWFTINSMIVQIDASGHIVTMLQTLYMENQWSPRNLRPVEAFIRIRSDKYPNLEKQVITHLSLRLIDEFTNAELDLLALYAARKTSKEVTASKGWSQHTVHEYNANLLRKAKDLFVYDFRSARSFAEYCAEKGYIQFPKAPK